MNSDSGNHIYLKYKVSDISLLHQTWDKSMGWWCMRLYSHLPMEEHYHASELAGLVLADRASSSATPIVIDGLSNGVTYSTLTISLLSFPVGYST